MTDMGSMTPLSSSTGLEQKFTALSALSETGARGKLAGYASRFGEADQSGDVVARGAFARSLERLKAQNRSVKLLWQHDPSQPIGVWNKVAETKTGLWVSGEVLTDLRQGHEAAVLMAAGAIDGLSIGYRVIRSEKNRETGGRTLIEVDLWEVSLVTFPMLPTARMSDGPPIEDPVEDAPKAARTPDTSIAAALAEVLAG